MGDDLFRKYGKTRHERKSKELKTRSETWLIVCEGEKTEPNYLNSLFDYANSKSGRKIKTKIIGEGRNTESLVSSVDEFFSYIDDLKRKTKILYGKTFVVFDRDSFTKKQFNDAIYTAARKGYIPIWSNECIELWFLLHFNLLESNITRDEYYKRLSDIFGAKYNKSDDHFAMLNTEVNLKNAMRNSKLLFCRSESINSPADRAPCTTVFQLVEEIENYIGMKLCKDT